MARNAQNVDSEVSSVRVDRLVNPEVQNEGKNNVGAILLSRI
jgi:hypothetical protein